MGGKGLLTFSPWWPCFQMQVLEIGVFGVTGNGLWEKGTGPQTIFLRKCLFLFSIIHQTRLETCLLTQSIVPPKKCFKG